MRRTLLISALCFALGALAPACAQQTVEEADAGETVAPVNSQPWMNVFRRYEADDEAMFAFYADVLGLERLASFGDVGAGGVHRFQAGDAQFKMTRRVPDRSYVPGGVEDATGVRLFSLFYPDEEAVIARFEAAGLPAPEFRPLPGSTRSAARVQDPDGQWLELVAAPGEGADVLDGLEVGITVSDLDASVAFYRDFVGLEEIAPEEDVFLGATKTRFRHGSTIVSLRAFRGDRPADTGSGGIQYVVSDVELVDRLAKERGVAIEQPLSGLPGYALRTIWLDDPDGITNYFAQVGVPDDGASD